MELMQRLVDASYSVSVETSGALSVERVPVEVATVLAMAKAKG